MAGAFRNAGKVLRLPEVESLVGLKKTSINYRMDPQSKYYDATFPNPVEIGGRAVGWLEEEILAWVAARPRRGKKGTTSRKASAVQVEKNAKGNLPPEAAVHGASSEDAVRSNAEKVLSDTARARKVLSYYQFIECVRQRTNVNVSLTDEVLDRIDTAEYEARGLLPTVVIQERGSPLSRTRRLASRLGLDLSSEQVKVQRKELFLAQLGPKDPRPVDFFWIQVGRSLVMTPRFEQSVPVDPTSMTAEEEERATALRARYDALMPKTE
jgi:prophage regulatory protein